MKLAEIFKSIQGESTFVGLPCSFIRLAGCNLRCSYCDTPYVWETKFELTIPQIIEIIKSHKTRIVEITGGEPLLQDEVYVLMERLVALNYKVLLETNGSLDISRVSNKVIKIIDIKCPGSGMSDRMYWDNLDKLNSNDEIKFVLSNRADYDWAKKIMKKYSLENRGTILFGVAYGKLPLKDVAEWILKDNLNVRLNPQLHKYIWGDIIGR
ncbi:MAG TPA: radical SAM protein [bacterium (Candidatus Stahlbacteria)]|nr:radical SAM protein [Candidatus Stahlbacteria bacterium]